MEETSEIAKVTPEMFVGTSEIVQEIPEIRAGYETLNETIVECNLLK